MVYFSLDQLLSDLFQCEEDMEIKVRSYVNYIREIKKYVLERNWSLKGKGVRWKQLGHITKYKIAEEISWSNDNSHLEWHIILLYLRLIWPNSYLRVFNKKVYYSGQCFCCNC